MSLKCKFERRVDQFRAGFELPFRKWLNRKKPRLFVFTDSRGVDVTRSWKKGNALHGYVYDLCKKYQVDYMILPEKHTTIADFFYYYAQTSKNYDAIVIHALAVDIAPRPKSSVIKDLYELKRERYDEIFGPQAMEKHLEKNLDLFYNDEVTHNAFSEKMMLKSLVPKLLEVPNLIFIGSNPILENWDGNYWQKRPRNINILESYSKLICKKLPNSISLAHWDRETIQKYSCDNIHFTPEGLSYLSQKIEDRLEKILR